MSESATYEGVFRSGSIWYQAGPIVDGKLRVLDELGERWIEPKRVDVQEWSSSVPENPERPISGTEQS